MDYSFKQEVYISLLRCFIGLLKMFIYLPRKSSLSDELLDCKWRKQAGISLYSIFKMLKLYRPSCVLSKITGQHAKENVQQKIFRHL